MQRRAIFDPCVCFSGLVSLMALKEEGALSGELYVIFLY